MSSKQEKLSSADAIESILLFIDMMFIPQELYYVTDKSSQTDRVYPLQSKQAHSKELTDIENFDGAYAWLDSEKGFWARISYQGVDFGILVVDEVQFPENKNHYLNLTLSITDICGLTIENARRNQQIKETEEKDNIEEALGKIQTLSGLLPICSYCKKIRDDSGYWNQIEHYLHEHSEVEFSHSICKDCADEKFPDLDLYSEE